MLLVQYLQSSSSSIKNLALFSHAVPFGKTFKFTRDVIEQVTMLSESSLLLLDIYKDVNAGCIRHSLIYRSRFEEGTQHLFIDNCRGSACS